MIFSAKRILDVTILLISFQLFAVKGKMSTSHYLLQRDVAQTVRFFRFIWLIISVITHNKKMHKFTEHFFATLNDLKLNENLHKSTSKKHIGNLCSISKQTQLGLMKTFWIIEYLEFCTSAFWMVVKDYPWTSLWKCREEFNRRAVGGP